MSLGALHHIHVYNNTLVRLCGLLIVLCFFVHAGICLSEHIEESEVSKFKCEFFTNLLIADMTSLCVTNGLMYNKHKPQMMLQVSICFDTIDAPQQLLLLLLLH
uniref:Uncharacterized protein n=1 Tax=Glossina austeni TaxID=7395 RepID=A0A1A9UVL7_GLOAU